ncbi:hypothetical protein M0L20_16940 [Spirosoma sp. RP8]|uniref:DUF4375 domain-containing protein n=1 Tax=Spirosoma liriopis TaxID=2937440 RepID=A0ABT0HNK4_9BACT|nr:hypothetical protein [Spirosoma liriopis]MCK8493555.1 hypothetical protein [Spirosoma liriopis]
MSTQPHDAPGRDSMPQPEATPAFPSVIPRTNYSLVLPLIVRHGNQEAGAMLIYRAISQYKSNVLRNLLQSYSAEDHSSTVEDLRDLELLEGYSLELVSALETAARANYQAYCQTADPEEYRQSYQEWEQQDDKRYNEYYQTYSR